MRDGANAGKIDLRVVEKCDWCISDSNQFDIVNSELRRDRP
jgi:hypothetical protein